MKKTMLPICVAVMMLLFSQQAFADWTFTTIPANGMISGKPGDTIGWGYSITNDDASNWLVVSGISAGSFQFGTPDDSIFDYPILAPLTTATVSYDGSMGLYQLTWDASAPAGLVNIGSFTLTAEYYDSDPYISGAFVDYAPNKSANYSATVEQVNAVPEPATMLLLGLGLVGLAGIRRKFKE